MLKLLILRSASAQYYAIGSPSRLRISRFFLLLCNFSALWIETVDRNCALRVNWIYDGFLT